MRESKSKVSIRFDLEGEDAVAFTAYKRKIGRAGITLTNIDAVRHALANEYEREKIRQAVPA